MKTKIKGTVFTLLLSGAGILAMAGCGHKNPSFNKPYRAEVLTLNSVDALGNENWSVEEKELATLEKPDSLEGAHFKVILGGTIEINSNVGSLVEGKSRSENSSGFFRFSSRNGVMVGRDTTSLLALSTFYAFEQVVMKVKETTGFEPTDLIGNSKESYKIFLEPALVDAHSDKKAVLIPKLNAAFNPFSDEFYFFRRSELEVHPFSANIKVIAHEFGHALFKKAFFKGKNDFCVSATQQEIAQRLSDKFFAGRFTNEFAISGLNEGYADFNSYVMTSSPRVLSGAVAGTNDASRALNGPDFTFNQLPSEAVCSGAFYCIGTLFARSLYSAAQTYAAGSKELMAFSRRINEAITATPDILNLPPARDILPSPSASSAQCKRSQKISLSYDGAMTSAFLHAFLKSFPEGEEKSKLCTSFAKFFGDSGFNKEARSVCPS
ncbi:MAG: hypothetical protein RIR26_2288 [Pseudomonadota bacterium]|jgi:hypothetical protein